MNKSQNKVKKYLEERGWDKLHPVDLAKSIMIEGAELLEIFQWDASRNKKEIDAEQLGNIKKELADVLIYCLQMGVILNFDIDKIIDEKLAKAKEKYPAHLFTKNNALENDTDKMYKTIKQSYRKGRNK